MSLDSAFPLSPRDSTPPPNLLPLAASCWATARRQGQRVGKGGGGSLLPYAYLFCFWSFSLERALPLLPCMVTGLGQQPAISITSPVQSVPCLYSDPLRPWLLQGRVSLLSTSPFRPFFFFFLFLSAPPPSPRAVNHPRAMGILSFCVVLSLTPVFPPPSWAPAPLGQAPVLAMLLSFSTLRTVPVSFLRNTRRILFRTPPAISPLWPGGSGLRFTSLPAFVERSKRLQCKEARVAIAARWGLPSRQAMASWSCRGRSTPLKHQRES